MPIAVGSYSPMARRKLEWNRPFPDRFPGSARCPLAPEPFGRQPGRLAFGNAALSRGHRHALDELGLFAATQHVDVE